MTIQERIDFLMKKQNISKAELARRIEKPYTTVDNWFKRNSDPGSICIDPIAKALNVSIEYLVTGTDTLPDSTLPEDEKQLLSYYQKCNQDGKNRILEQAEFIASKYPAEGKIIRIQDWIKRGK